MWEGGRGGGSGGGLSTGGGAMALLVGERTLGCSMGVKLMEIWSFGHKEKSLKLSRGNPKEWGEIPPLGREDDSKKMDEKTLIGGS
jgi:hypothetical protein